MDNLNNTTLVSSIATLFLASITFIQVFVITSGCVISFNNYYYLVLKNVGNNCCRIFNKPTRELFRIDNVSKYDCLPFSGFI